MEVDLELLESIMKANLLDSKSAKEDPQKQNQSKCEQVSFFLRKDSNDRKSPSKGNADNDDNSRDGSSKESSVKNVSSFKKANENAALLEEKNKNQKMMQESEDLIRKTQNASYFIRNTRRRSKKRRQHCVCGFVAVAGH